MHALNTTHWKARLVAKRGCSYVLFHDEIDRQIRRGAPPNQLGYANLYNLNAVEFFIMSLCRYLSPHATKHIQAVIVAMCRDIA